MIEEKQGELLEEKAEKEEMVESEEIIEKQDNSKNDDINKKSYLNILSKLNTDKIINKPTSNSKNLHKILIGVVILSLISIFSIINLTSQNTTKTKLIETKNLELKELEEKNKTEKLELEQKFFNLQSEFNEYKKKMQPYENLQKADLEKKEAELKAEKERKEAEEKAEREKKEAEEKAKKEAEEKAKKEEESKKSSDSSLLQEIKDKNFDKTKLDFIVDLLSENFENIANVYYNENLNAIAIDPKPELSKALIEYMSNQNNTELKNAWNYVVKTQVDLSKAVMKFSKDVPIVVLNPTNRERLLLVTINGQTVYNYFNK